MEKRGVDNVILYEFKQNYNKVMNKFQLSFTAQNF